MVSILVHALTFLALLKKGVEVGGVEEVEDAVAVGGQCGVVERKQLGTDMLHLRCGKFVTTVNC